MRYVLSTTFRNVSLLFCLCAGPIFAETATPASRFVDSVGINIHLHYQDSAYADFPKVKAAIIDLGVHHVRDGLIDTAWLPYYSELSDLRKSGVGALLITSPGQSSAVLRAFRRHAPGVGEGFEAPNELDAVGGDWVLRANAELAEIAPVAKDLSLPVVGPSMTKRTSFGERLGSFDVGNLHNYFGGRNPGTQGWGDDGYGSYEWNLRLARRAFESKPLVTTETGYITDPTMSQGIPENVAGRYTVRLILEQYMHGIQRTYLYELLDTEIPSRHILDRFGLCRSDFSRKPAFVAVQALLKVLSDPNASVTAPRVDGLDLRLSGDLRNVHHLLFEKQNGEFYLALWVEELGYDVDGKKSISVSPRRVSVGLPTSWKTETLHFNDAGDLHQVATQNGATVGMILDDRVTFLHLVRSTAK